MKTRQFLRMGLILVSATLFTLTSCKKEKEEDVNTNSIQNLAKDENEVISASDDVLNDVNNFMSSNDKSINELGCNSTLDSSVVIGDSIKYYISLNGLNCSGRRNRVGKIEVTKHQNTIWRDAGAKVSVKFISVRITKVSNNKSVTVNGIKTHENVSGGVLADLGNGTSSIVHKVSGSISALFDNNTQRTWNISRMKTYSGTANNLTVTFDGFGSANGYNNLVTWGTNRDGEAFYTQINQSLVFKQTCDFDPVSGVKTHQIPSDSKKAILTFGYDANDNLITNSDCPSKYKVDWEKGTRSGTVYLSLN